jgi:hypothetical protein
MIVKLLAMSATKDLRFGLLIKNLVLSDSSMTYELPLRVGNSSKRVAIEQIRIRWRVSIGRKRSRKETAVGYHPS